MTSSARNPASVVALHLWGPPALVGALADRLGGGEPARRLVPGGDPLGRLLAGLLARTDSLPDPHAGADLVVPPTALGLVLYPGLAEVLARVLPDGGDAVRGLEIWRLVCEALLAAWARQRRQMVLMAAPDLGADLGADLAADPVAGPRGGPLAALADHFGLPLAAAGPQPPDLAAAPPEARLVAAGMLQVSQPLRDLQGRLAAASLPWHAAAGLPDPATPEALRNALQTALDGGARAVAQHERWVLLQQRRQDMTTETAAQEARHRVEDLEARIIALTAEAGRHRAEAEASAEACADIAARRERTQAEALAARDARIAALAQTAEQHRAETGAAVAEARAVRVQLAAQAVELARLTADLAAADCAAAAWRTDIGQLARDIALRDDRIRALAEALQRREDEGAALRRRQPWLSLASLRALSQGGRKRTP